MMSLQAELDHSNVVDVDLGSAEFKANAPRHMAEWARRRPFYVLGKGPPQVVVGRYADVHRVSSDTVLPAFSSRRIEQLQESITRIIDGMLDRIEASDGHEHAARGPSA
jgi:cytochrome P450